MFTPENLSIVVFLLFVATVMTRAAMLRSRGIKALVFAETDKSDFLLIPMILAIAYSAVARQFGLPIATWLIRPLWVNVASAWAGLCLCILALIGFITTMINFGESFRVGIDVHKPGGLVTHGMFAISRNPIYVCFLGFFAGLFLIHRNPVIAVSLVVFAATIHRQILREEKFLKEHYGTAYEEYCGKVRRYL